MIAPLSHRLSLASGGAGQRTFREKSNEVHSGSRMPTNDDLVRGWVSTDCGRGTSDILWSCLATIFLCVWTAIHLPVPYYSGQQSLSLRQKLVRSGIGPALITVIIPEFLTLSAAYELILCWREKEKIKRMTQIDWTLTHQYFLDMGGVCLKSTSGRYLQIQTLHIVRAMRARRSHGKQVTGSPDWISELAELTEDHIKGLAKADTISKLITCGQALWLITQVISRLCQHEAVTLLEVSTCGYVFCALLSYAVWWKKPQGCAIPIIIACSDDALSEMVRTRIVYHEDDDWGALMWAGRNWPLSHDFDGKWISFFCILTTCSTLFGAIHVASWNITLPSDIELWMWRMSSIYCSVVGVAIALLVRLLDVDRDPRIESATRRLTYVLGAVYIVVRIYMIVEVFLSLRALPRSAFESVQWSSFIPHV